MTKIRDRCIVKDNRYLRIKDDYVWDWNGDCWTYGIHTDIAIIGSGWTEAAICLTCTAPIPANTALCDDCMAYDPPGYT